MIENPAERAPRQESALARTHAYGQERLSPVDRFVVWLSRRQVLRWIPHLQGLKANPKVVALEGMLPRTVEAIPSDSLDVVFCLSVVEHLDQPDEMLRQIRRVLTPGGFALVNVPSWRGKFFLEFSAFRLGLSPAAEMDDHKQYYDVRDLWPKLVAAGFKPSRIRCFTHKFGLNTFAVCRKSPA